MKVQLFVVIFNLCTLFAAHMAHSTPSPNSDESLRDRYVSMACAIALIQTERGTGTGFFVNANGDMVTAAHVISTKSFSMKPNSQVDFTVSVDKQVYVTAQGQPRIQVMDAYVDNAESSTDLAFIHTTVKPPCFIPLGDSASTKTGDHLLSIGFPGIDNGNPILYEGFLSGRFPHPPTAVAIINGESIVPHYEILKVQMPITPGASGSPVIDDSGKVIAVISESPIIWTQDLESITKAAGSGSGIALSGFDVVKTLGQLALVVREFESPGSGYAVPVSGLNPKRASTGSGATRGH